MMKKRLTHIGIILAMALAISITGCSKGNTSSNDEGITNVTNSETKGADSSKDVDTKEEEVSSQKEEVVENDEKVIEPVKTKEVYIYTFNETSFNVESAVALVPVDQELTPELVVDTVVDSFADRLVEIGIDEVSTKDDTVIVSFKEDTAPYMNTGSGLEGSILDSIAQSLVDNFKEYPKVIFRVEGKAYASGHFEYGIDEVYLDGNRTN